MRSREIEIPGIVKGVQTFYDAPMRVGVYGLGRFGRFWAETLGTRFEVYGYSRTPKAIASRHFTLTTYEGLLSCDVIILCVSISAVEEVARSLARDLSPSTLVMDTCSVKTYPLEVLSRTLPDGIDILGTHPMFGPDSAREGIAGLPIVLTPCRVTEEVSSFWEETFREMGLSVHRMTAEEHDREAAYTQGITHFVGRVLGELHLEDSPIATVGYRKLLEIREQTCNDPWQLFLDLQHYNPYTRRMREDLAQAFTRILAVLDRTLDGGADPSVR